MEEVQSERAKSPIAIFTPKGSENPHDLDIEWHEVKYNEGGDPSTVNGKKPESKAHGKSSPHLSNVYDDKQNPDSHASVIKQANHSSSSTPLDPKVPGSLLNQMVESVEPIAS